MNGPRAERAMMPYPKTLKIGSKIRHHTTGEVSLINGWRRFGGTPHIYAVGIVLGTRKIFYVRKDRIVRKMKDTNEEYYAKKGMK